MSIHFLLTAVIITYKSHKF